jgi:hypothetical protein
MSSVAMASDGEGLRSPIGHFTMLGMDDKKRRYNIVLTAMAVALVERSLNNYANRSPPGR